jgi:hypothetical protein
MNTPRPKLLRPDAPEIAGTCSPGVETRAETCCPLGQRPLLTQIPKLGNRPRPRRRARPRFIGLLPEKKAELPGNYFVPFIGR